MKQKLILATLAAALLAAPALAAPTAQQQQSAALQMLQQKYVKLAKPEAQKMVNNVVESINNMLYKQPKGAIEIGQTDAERQDHMQAWAAAVYTTCINNGK